MSGRAELVERDAQVLKLRREGNTFDVIAEQVGYKTKSAAQKAYKRALDRTGGPETDRDQARRDQLDVCGQIRKALWSRVEDCDPHAIRQYLQVMRHEAYLLGLAQTPMRVPALDDPERGNGPPGGNVVPPDVLEKMRREAERARASDSSAAGASDSDA